MSDCCAALQDEFDDRAAARQRRRYARRGPDRTTRWLIEMLVEQGVDGATLLDIGGGLGSVQERLLAAGAASALSVEASAAYACHAADIAGERGYAARVERRVADFAEVADTVPAADVVSLDRVICCYPDMDRLVRLSAERARRLYGFVVPRDRADIRLAARLLNAFRRLLRREYRAYVHSRDGIERRLRAAGFVPVDRRRSFAWEVSVFRR